MEANQTDPWSEVSPAKALALVAAALGAALLGIAMLGATPAHVSKKQHSAANRSVECIVASAVFVGVSRVETGVH